MKSYEQPILSNTQHQVFNIAVTPSAPLENLTPVLKHLGWNGETVAGTDGVRIADKEPLLLIHCRPEWAVADALERGEEPHSALRNWEAEARKLLDTFKQRRDEAAMVDADAALERPQPMVSWLASHHPGFQHISPEFSATLKQRRRPSELNFLLAIQVVAQTPDIAPLLTQLEACSVPLNPQGYLAPKVDIASIMNQLAETQKQSESAVENETKARELEDLKEAKIRELEDFKEAKVRELEDLKETKDRELEDVKEENDLILKQLFKVQEELEKYYLESNKVKETLGKRETELKKIRSSNENLEKQATKLKKENRLLIASVQRLNAQQQGFKLGRLAAPVRKLTRANRVLRRSADLVRASELFDGTWYLKQNPDVAALAIDPALHYVQNGGAEGRAASPKFDSASYLSKNPDVANTGQNPLVHYLLHGKAEGRKL